MKRQAILWVLLIVIIGCPVGLVVVAQHQGWRPSTWNILPDNVVDPRFYKVTRVFDGDTILVNMDGASEKVRLIGVDTPETHDPDVDPQCFGKEASDFTTSLLLGRTVRLESDETNTNRDRYERLLRYVYTNDGALINNMLIEQGYGFAYTRFPFNKISQFIDSEKRAESQGQGLWSACGQIIKNGVFQTTIL